MGLQRWTPMRMCACVFILQHNNDGIWADYAVVLAERTCAAHRGLSSLEQHFLQVYAEDLALSETQAAIELARPELLVDDPTDRDPLTGLPRKKLRDGAWSFVFDQHRDIDIVVAGVAPAAARLLIRQPTAVYARAKASMTQLQFVTPPNMRRP